jgi:hypothetical protein
MNEPGDTPDFEAQRAELERTLERVRRKKRRNDAMEKSLISRPDLKANLQAAFLALEDQLESIHKKCVAQIAEIVSPELAEIMCLEIQETITEVLNETKEDFLRMLKQ